MVNKRSLLGLTAFCVVALFGICSADVPCDLTSTVDCWCDADPMGGSGAVVPGPDCTICPRGDGVPSFGTEDVFIEVTVRNITGDPLAGSTVIVLSMAIAVDTIVWDPGPLPAGDPDQDPQTGTSGADGVVLFVRDQGGIAWSEPGGAPVVLPNLDFDVTAQGPGPGSPVTLPRCPVEFNMVSFDMVGADCTVGLQDFGGFATCYAAGGADKRCDYNWSGAVDLVDFGHFATHWGHDCDDQ